MAFRAWCLASAASLELDSNRADDDDVADDADVRSCWRRPEDEEEAEEAAAMEATVSGLRMEDDEERSTERAEVSGRRQRGDGEVDKAEEEKWEVEGSCWVLDRSFG